MVFLRRTFDGIVLVAWHNPEHYIPTQFKLFNSDYLFLRGVPATGNGPSYELIRTEVTELSGFPHKCSSERNVDLNGCIDRYVEG